MFRKHTELLALVLEQRSVCDVNQTKDEGSVERLAKG